MKVLLITIALLFTVNIYSQEGLNKSEVVTTELEYQFLTEVYPNMKIPALMDGYRLDPFYKSNTEDFDISYELLVKDKNNELRAVFITITKIKKKDDKKEYLCLPINNPILFKKFWEHQYYKLGMSMTAIYDISNTALLSRFFDATYNK